METKDNCSNIKNNNTSNDLLKLNLDENNSNKFTETDKNKESINENTSVKSCNISISKLEQSLINDSNSKLFKKRDNSYWDENECKYNLISNANIKNKIIQTRYSKWEYNKPKVFTPLPILDIKSENYNNNNALITHNIDNNDINNITNNNKPFWCGSTHNYEILIRKSRLADVLKKISTSVWDDFYYNKDLRSPSPEPIYDSKTNLRINTFENRMKTLYIKEKNKLILELLELDQTFEAPIGWKKPKKEYKIYYYDKQEYNITSIIIGSLGKNMKELEKKTKCKISVKNVDKNKLNIIFDNLNNIEEYKYIENTKDDSDITNNDKIVYFSKILNKKFYHKQDELNILINTFEEINNIKSLKDKEIKERTINEIINFDNLFSLSFSHENVETLIEGINYVISILDVNSSTYKLYKEKQKLYLDNKMGIKNKAYNLGCENCGLKGHSTWMCPEM